MNVIFVGRNSGRMRQFDLRHPAIVAAAVLVVLAVVGGAFSLGMGLGARHNSAQHRRQADSTETIDRYALAAAH